MNLRFLPVPLRAALRDLRLRLRCEAGVALPMAIVTLSIVTSFAGVSVIVATQGNDSTIRDSAVKAADEAAETALNVATYRLNMIQPTTGNCITGNQVAGPGTNGWCQDSATESLGNGASFTYWDSTDSQPSCVGYTVVGQTGLTQRCITAQATVDGVTRRQQARVAEYASTPLFPYAGIIGLNGVSVSNNVDANSVVASNGVISVSNNADIGPVELGPSGTVSESNNVTVGTISKRSAAQGNMVLSPVDPGNSATVNDDYRITDGLASPKVAPYDASTGVSFNASTRTLSINNNGSLTLGGGIYNFCSFTTSNNVTITLAAGVSTQIFIDSPNRSGSGCAAHTGTFDMSNNSGFVNPSDNPTALQIYIYDNSGGTAYFSNNTVFYGTVYAPQSTVSLYNNAQFWGGIAGADILLSNNFAFDWGSQDASLTASAAGLYYRTAWEECQPPTSATMSAPASGC